MLLTRIKALTIWQSGSKLGVLGVGVGDKVDLQVVPHYSGFFMVNLTS